MSAFTPIPECPNISKDLLDYLRAVFSPDIGSSPRTLEAYVRQCGQQSVVEHLADQARRQAEGEA